MFFKQSNNAPNSDERLIKLIKAGGLRSRRATNTLFDQYRYLVEIGRSKHRISEEESLTAYTQTILSVVQQVQADQFRGDSSLKTYVSQIFARQCVNVIREKTTQKAMNWLTDLPRFPEKAQDLFQQIVAQESWQVVKQCMDQLSEQCQQILWGAVYEGFSAIELAAQLGLKNANTVNVLKSRCRKRLLSLVSQTGIH